MLTSIRRLLLLTGSLTTLLLAACIGGAPTGPRTGPGSDSAPPPPAPTLLRIQFVPKTMTIRRHNTAAVTVYGYYDRGDSVALHNVTLTAEDTTIAAVDTTHGAVAAVHDGVTTITATASGLSAALTVTVAPAFYVKLQPMNTCILVDLPGGFVSSVQYGVQLYDSTKTVLLPSEPVTQWTVDDTTIATISPSGLLQATNKVGITNVRATVRDEVGVGYLVTDDHPMGVAPTCDGIPSRTGAALP